MSIICYNDGKEVEQGVNLLISILLRYPEIGTLRYIQNQQSLKFTFLTLSQVPAIATILPEALEVFHHLEGRTMNACQIQFHWEEDIGTITIVRDIKTMNHHEVRLIVELVKRTCGEGLVIEPFTLGEEELMFQEEILCHIFDNLSSYEMMKSMTAAREDGRVLVFNN